MNVHEIFLTGCAAVLFVAIGCGALVCVCLGLVDVEDVT